MRRLFQEQLELTGPVVDHPHARELEGMDRILRGNPGIPALVLQDLQRGLRVPDEGREGMTAEQVLRAALLKQMNTWSYDELSFHLADSWSYRSFCGVGCLAKPPSKATSKATLQRSIKSITEAAWEAINRILVGYAARRGVEDGRKVRIDATVTETDIHFPTDSSLLWDCVRVLTRLMRRAHEDCGAVRFPDRTRRAKRRALEVLNAKNARKRRSAYRDLLKVTKETVGYARSAAVSLAVSLEARGGARWRAGCGLSRGGTRALHQPGRAGHRPNGAARAPRRIGSGHREGGLDLQGLTPT